MPSARARRTGRASRARHLALEEGVDLGLVVIHQRGKNVVSAARETPPGRSPCALPRAACAISRSTTSRRVSRRAIGPIWAAPTVTNLATSRPLVRSRIDRPITVLARTTAAHMQIPRLRGAGACGRGSPHQVSRELSLPICNGSPRSEAGPKETPIAATNPAHNAVRLVRGTTMRAQRVWNSEWSRQYRAASIEIGRFEQATKSARKPASRELEGRRAEIERARPVAGDRRHPLRRGDGGACGNCCGSSRASTIRLGAEEPSRTPRHFHGEHGAKS